MLALAVMYKSWVGYAVMQLIEAIVHAFRTRRTSDWDAASPRDRILRASYNRLSKIFSRSDTKQTQKRSSFRDQMGRPWKRQKSELPLCSDCDARTFAEWEKRSCLSSFDVYRHRQQTVAEKLG